MTHFSFTRTTYDNCALQQKDNGNTAMFSRVADPSVNEVDRPCLLGASPFMHNPFKSIPSNFIDAESDLRGQTRIQSKCAITRFNPQTAPKYSFHVNECTDINLVPEYTRTKRPCNVLSGISINRFDPLCDDPQDTSRIHNNTYIGSNTRLQIKDAHAKKAAASPRIAPSNNDLSQSFGTVILQKGKASSTEF